MELEIATIPTETALAVFTQPGMMDPYLQKVRVALDTFVPDVTTRSGRKEIASVAAKVSKYKAALESVGSDLAREQKAIPAKIDATRRHVKDTLDHWRDEVRQPLTDWEAAEEARIKQHEDAVALLQSATTNLDGRTVQELSGALERVEAVVVGPECEEYEEAYTRAKAAAIEALTKAITARQRYDAEQEELRLLRQQAAERAQRERDEAIRAEAAEKARVDAERAAQAEVARIEAQARADREAAERAAGEADRQAKAEAGRVAAEAAQREAALQAEAEAARRLAAETEARVRREAEETARREAAEAAAREANTRHKAAINRKAVDALVAGGLDVEAAKLAVTLIARRSVPAVTISY